MWDSPMHLLIVLLIVFFMVIVLFPVARILRRTGHSGWWCLLFAIPFVNWLSLWIFAYARWPALDKTKTSQ